MPAETHRTAITAPAPELSWRLVRADGRAPETVAFEESVVAFFLDAATILGVPKSVAAIYGICFASAEPLSFADIAERLDISKGSISQGLRVLREVGALRVVEADGGPTTEDGGRTTEGRRRTEDGGRKADVGGVRPEDGGRTTEDGGQTTEGQVPGPRRDASRRDYYEPDLKLRKLAARWIEQRLQSQLDAGKSRLEGIVKSVPGGKSNAAKVLKDRVKTLQAWHDQTRALLPVMKTFLKL